ncbi:TIGR03862 family flavoprotein [Dechloromonas sp. HYN0024]|uniref:TIGR03862 family flavoprotein n=1 Tax=Dechloromonas sp. HYN0024 TaxID=2231055 RepID=UPI000E43B3F4|nr:TIGR03862 family flavoprotein [Dechloromonas sp. HYN0024]AXS79459.1 TIGR03862 family flavoprotein [Dechloromonas sp. HYN0024]
MQRVAIIGGGPAGLMAAEVLAAAPGGSRRKVDIFDAMPSVGRKFLMAGKGGMNITHSEPLADFTSRYGERAAQIAPLLDIFGPTELREWIHGLGIDTFVGTSGRVFPTDMKAAPLLRAWLHRLRGAGVQFHVRHRWLGWTADGSLRFATPAGAVELKADAVILALGGGSWAKLGADGSWVPVLSERGIPVAPLKPANCGFDVAWSPYFSERFAGAPVKAVTARWAQQPPKQGEFNITASGIEGGLIYALSAPLRDALARHGKAELTLDLAPGRSLERLTADLARPRGRDSLANHLRRHAGIDGVKAGLLREFCPPDILNAAPALAAVIKALPLPVKATRPIDEAISTAGGVAFEGLDEHLMLRAAPGVFCAGEMLDWEAPTGGYLLTGCLASGRVAGLGAVGWLEPLA